MPDLMQWKTNATDFQPIDATDRAAFAWQRIQRDLTDIILTRDGIALDAQPFRVEADNIARLEVGGASPLVTRSTLKVTLFGIRDHASLSDSDILRGDRFSLASYPGASFEVIQLTNPPGEIQALCEAQQGS